MNFKELTGKKRKEVIVKMRESGLSYKQIGEKFGVTRQCIHQIFKKTYKNNKTFCNIEGCLNKIPEGNYVYCKEHTYLSKLLGRDLPRERVRLRDKHTCQMCDKKWKEGERRFDVHHIDCEKEKSLQYDDYEKEKDNMITFCHKCHMRLPEHRLTMKTKKTSKGINPERKFLVYWMKKDGLMNKEIAYLLNFTRLQCVNGMYQRAKKILE